MIAEDHFLNLQPGTIVNGRYEVVKCLGTGSMGLVYACRHRELSGHLVAMKVLFSEVARDEVASARFRNEIVASYGVNHPNVVRAYEYFRDGDLVAFTMEYVGGGDLADLIGLDEKISVPQIILMLKQMCGGVQAIHDAGIIHRDLKPENILLTENGDIKITDFGIARTGSGQKLTEHGGVVGTIDYVSPEYLEKGQVDFRSDIYALGILGYEMLTGESPFKGNSVIETMTMRLKTDPATPQRLRPDCPKALADIILHAMRRNPEDRYQRAEEMYDDLGRIEFNDRVTRDEFVSIPAGDSRKAVVSHRDEDNADRAATFSVESSVGQRTQRDVRSDDSKRQHDVGSTNRLIEERKRESRLARNSQIAGEFFEGSNQESYLAADSLVLSQPKKTVSVSQSRLSSQRIKELSEEFNYDEGEQVDMVTILLSFFVVAAGLLVGLLVIYKLWPDALANNPLIEAISWLRF